MVLKKQLYFVALVICIAMAYSIFLFAEEQNILFLTQEDGFYETLTAIFFLIASFFFGFGEEISWGQRIFNIETPEALKEINIQGEMNIHNIEIFHGKDAKKQVKSFWAKFSNMGRLFSIFCLVFGVIIPILEKNSLSFSRWIKKVNIPIVPIWMGLFFLINYMISKVLELILSINFGHSIVEIKECNSALIFLMVGLFFLHNNKMIKN